MFSCRTWAHAKVTAPLLAVNTGWSDLQMGQKNLAPIGLLDFFLNFLGDRRISDRVATSWQSLRAAVLSMNYFFS
jgi:hypothetical protein